MPADQTSRSAFFFYYACILLLVVTGGFGFHALIKPANLPPVSQTLIFHAIFTYSWYVLFTVQTGLIRTKRPALHMRLGKMSVALALGVVITGILISIAHYLRKPEGLVFMGGLVNMANFSLLYGSAVFMRNRSDWHKRLMLFAGIAMMAPVLARVVRAADLNEFAALPMWLLLIFVPAIYDLTSSKKVHKATLLGIALIIGGIVIMITIGMSSAWTTFLKSTLG
ncbi:MAG TPA: hypothetical protein PKE66_05400 [Pyrinomonadaceae bacterium]|nr:hypothetical protein [Pyrinomonadaceae bacterium]